MQEVSTEDFISISKLSPEERANVMLKQIVELEHLWGLFGKEGWLLLQAEEDTCLPVWPTESFATAWEKEDFPDCKPQQIQLNDFLEQWLPGMQKNGTLILMFPMSDDEEGIMLTGSECKQYIEEEMR